MQSNEETVDANLELARTINREALANPDSPYAGKYVGIAHGEVVAADEDLGRVQEALRAREPDRMQRLIIEASVDYETPCEIW